jgi:heat shock protein HtpX
MEQIKTIGLLTFLTVMLVMLGGYFGGQGGALIALVIAGGMNFYAYYFSDQMVLRHYKAIEVNEQNASGLYGMVEWLAKEADLPMPKVYIIPDATPNAFATGRNPEHAAVAVTEGLLNHLDDNEVAAVIAHELSHVRHYDILIATVAATIAGAIAMIANFMQFAAMFGGGRDGNRNPIVMILLAIVLPIAAMIIQMTISRSREFKADEGAALLTGHPEWLQSALQKLENYAHRSTMRNADEQTAHMFIVNPFSGHKVEFANLFRTHPTTEQRVARLEAVKMELQYGGKEKRYDRHYR